MNKAEKMVLALALALGTAQAVLGGNHRLPVRGICAHQGDCQFFPGNTVEALASAVRKGAAMVEFDVQRCKSGEFVLMHDATIDRLTTGTGRICDHTLEELKSYTYRKFPEKACRIATLDEVLDVLPKDGLLINVHCYAGSRNMGAIVQKLKERGRLHQAFVTAKLKDIDLARKAAPEVAANNIERPGPRNRDWTPQENAKFVSDAIAHRCQYLQLSRPWPRQYSDDAHAGGVKVIHFHAEKPEELKDLMVERGIDFVMTNHLTPMIEAFKALGLSADATGIPQPKAVREADALSGVRVPPSAVEDDPITYIAHQGEEALEISKGMRKGVWIDFKDFRPPFAENVFRMLGVDALVTNCKANTFPATKPETAARARLMRLLAQVPGVVSDAAQGVRAKAFELCVWSPERAAETIEKSGRAPKTAEEAFEILVNQNSTERNTRT